MLRVEYILKGLNCMKRNSPSHMEIAKSMMPEYFLIILVEMRWWRAKLRG
jgi:hypothetical protein